MGSAEGHPVIRWLMSEARQFTEPSAFLDAFARRLLEAGVAVTRVTTGVPLPHPQIASFSGLWQLGKGVSERRYRAISSTMDALLNSPIVITYRGEGPVRCIIGDAMLAIFPVADAPAPACRRALAAAATARAALLETNRARAEAGLPRIAYGLGLHVGEVLYGNIGGESRLDFTVIGPAVNLTARIESLCGELKRELLLSADFVSAAGVPAEEVGEFELHGVGERQRVFAPRGPD